MLAVIKNIAPYFLYFAWIAVCFISLTGRVRYGLFFLVPLLPLQNIVDKFYQFPLGKDFNDILLICMLIGWVISKHSNGKPLFEKTSYNGIFLLYLIFTYISLWHGSSFLGLPAPVSVLDPRVQNWKNYMVLPLLFLIAFNNLDNKNDIKRLFILMCASMLLMNYYNVNQVSWMTAWYSRAKIVGTFVWLGANEVAAFYATYTLVIAGIFLFTKDKRLKLFLAALIVVNLYLDLFMMSRGAYLATLVGLLFLSIIRVRKLLIPIIIALIFWQAFMPSMVIERVEYTNSLGELDISAQTRLVLWEESIRYFKESPLIGIGFNVFSLLGMKRDAHNVFLRTLAEQGLIGLNFLIIIFLIALRRGWRLYMSAQDEFLKGLGLGFCACTLAVIVGNLFGDRWTPMPLAAYFWVFLGMVERGNLIAATQEQEAVVAENNRGRVYGREAISREWPTKPKRVGLAEALRGNGRRNG